MLDGQGWARRLAGRVQTRPAMTEGRCPAEAQALWVGREDEAATNTIKVMRNGLAFTASPGEVGANDVSVYPFSEVPTVGRREPPSSDLAEPRVARCGLARRLLCRRRPAGVCAWRL